MHVELHPRFSNTREGQTAQALTSACVHCGFCLATCPTYLDSRDERDSPRGRIYLIKQLLESGSAGEATREHLDRCLTCRHCETTCPSGMQYGELVDIGRGLMEQQAPRRWHEKSLRWLLRFVFAKPQLLRAALSMGRILKPLFTENLRKKIPPRQQQAPVPDTRHERSMLILEGCVQSAATPNTNASARRVLDRLGITLVSAPRVGCCGALNYHLAAHDQGLDDMRRAIDAWWPFIEQGVEAIVSSASGCGALLNDYGRLLAEDPTYAQKARRVSELTRDLGEILLDEPLTRLNINTDVGKIAVHTPCSMQNALQQPQLVTDILQSAGFELAPGTQTLCCGSAGTYSILQTPTSERLLEKTLQTLTKSAPALIATANVGCQLHLQTGSGVPVVHWIELLDTPEQEENTPDW